MKINKTFKYVFVCMLLNGDCWMVYSTCIALEIMKNALAFYINVVSLYYVCWTCLGSDEMHISFKNREQNQEKNRSFMYRHGNYVWWLWFQDFKVFICALDLQRSVPMKTVTMRIWMRFPLQMLSIAINLLVQIDEQNIWIRLMLGLHIFHNWPHKVWK